MSNSSTPESSDNHPQNRTYEKPVAWLAGRDLLGGIKGMLLYTAYGSKLDPRDWMSGKVASFDSGGEKEFWFDFIADAGDGTKAMYSIAYMTMTDLWENADNEPLTIDGKRQVAFETGEGRTQLPRGQFLIFGGDTAYHVADYLTIANRIQRPFTWAYLDLHEQDQDIDVRPVFGIPGNHDYYDQLDGFRRQFRKPARKEPPQPPKNPGGNDAQLGLAGYYRTQQASYFALKLPFDWWLWGLDTETGEIDPRQTNFFLSRGEEGDDPKVLPPPDKLIIVTPSPSTVFGKSADKENDFKATKALIELLGSDQPFLPKVQEDGSLDFSQTGDHQLKPGQCRLDIAGDVHHYARYWGLPPEKPTQVRQRAARKPVPQARSYASIVTGLGGAFHHPSNTYDDEIQEQVLYPTEKDSREEVGKALFDFRSIWNGGYVFLFGAIIASLFYFAMSVTQSSRQDISQIPGLEHLNLVHKEPIRPTAVREKPCAEVPPLRPLNLITLGPSFKPPGCDPGTPPGCPPGCVPARPFYFFITESGVWPVELWVGTILILLSLGGTFGTFALNTWLFGPKRDPRKPRDDRLPKPTPGRRLLLVVPPIVIAVLIGMYTVGRYRAYITPFVSSMLVLFTMIVAAGGIVLTVRYNDYLFMKGHDDYIKKRDRIWPWVLPFLSVLVFGSGLSAFARNNLPALLVTDMLLALVFVGMLVGLIWLLPVKASGELFYALRPRWFGKILKILIGLWHAVLQLFVPFVLIRKGTYWTWIIAAVLLLIPIRFSERLFKNSRGILLAILWVAYGSFVLVLPWLTSHSSRISFFLPSHFAGTDWLAAPWGLLPTVLAGIAGAVMSCLWFGWYLGICSVFNGHNNEVGGAARIEKFKQFIRFKVTKDRLTGYVIAVDDVSLIGEQDESGKYYDGRALKPKLIEVFHLEPKT